MFSCSRGGAFFDRKRRKRRFTVVDEDKFVSGYAQLRYRSSVDSLAGPPGGSCQTERTNKARQACREAAGMPFYSFKIFHIGILKYCKEEETRAYTYGGAPPVSW